MHVGEIQTLPICGEQCSAITVAVIWGMGYVMLRFFTYKVMHDAVV